MRKCINLAANNENDRFRTAILTPVQYLCLRMERLCETIRHNSLHPPTSSLEHDDHMGKQDSEVDLQRLSRDVGTVSQLWRALKDSEVFLSTEFAQNNPYKSNVSILCDQQLLTLTRCFDTGHKSRGGNATKSSS